MKNVLNNKQNGNDTSAFISFDVRQDDVLDLYIWLVNMSFLAHGGYAEMVMMSIWKNSFSLLITS